VIPQLEGSYKLAALSNHGREWAEFMQREFDFFRHFDQVVFSCDVHLRKPDPEIYKLCLSRINSKPPECLFVDDKKRNTDAASGLGMKILTLERNVPLRDELQRLGIRLEEHVT
jgi:HAD superfamily hydrolase (TIGR01509 family)